MQSSVIFLKRLYYAGGCSNTLCYDVIKNSTFVSQVTDYLPYYFPKLLDGGTGSLSSPITPPLALSDG